MMAARKNLSHDDKTRERIKTSQLVNRLQDNAFGTKTGSAKEYVELTAGQLKSIEILLRKSLPDLSAITLSGSTTTRLIVETGVDRKAG